ncbi:hypothetical protein GE115_09480 [Agromyces sp. CFH 90414]|uniref:Polysaccharide biosynthesis protein n=1 Tax=Agromyces agglutinans TaxID=2662258 RepID=A0A6I2F665_9MICO|nr:hypothetical protein [Agromyces agglutinans]MRG60099.1 hypothetical protein [Agromyces agglutinans]
MNSLLALGAKAATMCVALICGILTTRLILGDAGVEAYALFTLLASLPSLLAFTDLGAGAVVVNSVATSDDIRTDRTVLAQLTTVGRILLGFAGATMAVNLTMLLTGAWSLVLGSAGDLPQASLAAFFCVMVFAFGVPVGIWVRIMLGLRRNHITILLQGLLSPLTLLGVWLILQSDAEAADSFIAIASFTASLFVSVIGLLITARLTRPLVNRAASRVLLPGRFPGSRVMDVGWPMLAQLITYPIAVSSHRFVLAQWGTPAEVAEYGVAGQVFFALNGLVMAAGVALWPLFANRRHKGELKRGPFALSAVFATCVGVATGVLWMAGPWIFGFITDGELDVARATIAAFGAMIGLIAAVYPLGMFIMDKPGIRFQVIPTLTMAICSLGLGILLAGPLGTAGPPLGTAVAVAVCQVVPFSIYIVRHRDRLLGREAATADAPDERHGASV